MTKKNIESWRSGFHILVTDVHALGAIAVVRSLGRAGYRVHACDSDSNAVGLQSRYVTASIVAPDYSDAAFIDWLRTYLSENPIRLIIPSEGFLHAIRPWFSEFQRFLPLSDDPEIVYRAFSKIDVSDCFSKLSTAANICEHLPPTLIVREGDALPTQEQLEALGVPVYIKSDVKYSIMGNESLLVRVTTASAVADAIQRALESHRAIMVQGFVPGMKAALAFCIKNGKVLATSGVLGLRMNPHTGGMMCLRKSVTDILPEAICRGWLEHLEWEGVAMIECKWDPATNRFWFIELNSRYWGYLHLDLYSGIDMPRIQADAFFGVLEQSPPVQRLGVLVRHIVPGDVGFLRSLLKDERVTLGRKLRSISRFILDIFDPRVKSDLWFPGDRMLYIRQWQLYFRDIFRS